jgi:uncharacterized protein (UPF0218 family)
MADMQGASDPMAGAVAALVERLRLAREPYELLSATPDEARLRFTGPFEGAPVVWEARVRRVGVGESRFIAVGDRTAHAVPLEVGLDVAAIDEPTLRKTVVMVRQWKRLRAGRHEFG